MDDTVLPGESAVLPERLGGVQDPTSFAGLNREVTGTDEFTRRLRMQLQFGQELAKQMSSIPGALPSLDDEIWIIQKPANWDAARADDIPGCGGLLAGFEPDTPRDKLVPVPLKHTDVRAHIGGLIASTVVTQQFVNPYDAKIEAVYVFPLPENAAVNEFVMTIGERRIRGIIRDRAEAEQMYAEARAQGYVASLLTQERPNVFTQKVANIEPGKAIDVSITYFHTLPYRDGSFEYVFPMVVGPRFNPPPAEGFAAGSGIGAVPRDASGSSGQRTEVQYLAPDERSGLDVSLEVDIDAGVPLGEIACKSHTVAIRHDSGTGATIRLARETTIPNKDFVLRFAVADSTLQSGMITWVDPESGRGYFAMLVVPPAELASLPRRPMEMVFVVDASGSMNGAPIEQAKAAVRRGLRMLEPGDTFQLINFSESASQLGARPVDASPDSVRHADRYLDKLLGAGGTMMINGIRASLDFPSDGERTRFVCFLTDGFIGNEAEILGEMRPRLNGAHVFSFGVGSAPNRYLMERMAKLGQGAVAYLSLEDDGGEVMANFFERVAHPALANLAIEWPALEQAEVYPASLPDVYVGRPVVITGRFDPAKADAPVRLTGAAGQTDFSLDVTNTRIEDDALARGLRAVWARNKIAALMDEATYEPNAHLAADVKEIALDNSLMSAFTAFIAVDSSRVTEGSTGTTVAVPVSVPEGVKYETTVPGGG
ncbi:MAG: VWA domain-containing protein [Phycisphaerales bacterium]|nr:VWA domain-containing protein [Phycisphaerales bacterium]